MIGIFRKKPKITFLGANLLLLFCTVLFNEWAVYILWPYYYRWPRMECGGVTEFYKILFVADPQILGERDEWWIARWDSDRYLTNTFSLGLNHVKPDLIVFLGDLMDEGTIASSAQYSRYIERFTKIFSLNNLPSNMTVFLPGDNDIGGEDERVTKSKVTRFNTYFSQPSIINLGDIQFIKVNKMEHTYPKVKTGNNKTVRVIVSHVPLLGLPSWFSEDAIITLKPNMIFSAHDHKSVHFAGDRKTGERILAEPLVHNDQSNDWPMTWRFQLTTSVVNEVLVPTCSYRMGTYLMGYGAAIIDKRGEALCYSVLKLPQRFLHLYFYLLILTLMLILSILFLKLMNKASHVARYFM